jgi:hypothetical protein
MNPHNKQCSGKCQEHKLATLENFRRQSTGKLGLRATCRKCENEYNRAKAKLNKDKWAPAKRNGELLRKYGITLDTYNTMLISQDYSCKICDYKATDNQNLCVDHCHKTGRVRGLLCHRCNTLLGAIENINKTNTLEKIEAYLKS